MVTIYLLTLNIENKFKKACIYKTFVLPLLHNQLNNTAMTTIEKKQAILNVIFERACELENEAISLIGLVLPKNVDYEALKEAALKKAFQEWKENKPVFNKPAFL